MSDTKPSTTGGKNSNSSAEYAPVFIELGKQSRKKIRSLKKSKGELYKDVQEAVEELRDSGKIQQNAQVVFINLKQKRKRNRFDQFGLGLLR